jgi:hypothetical protein
LDHEIGESIPLVMRQTVDYIKTNGKKILNKIFDEVLVGLGLNEPGIFRRAALVSLIKQVQEKYNEGLMK